MQHISNKNTFQDLRENEHEDRTTMLGSGTFGIPKAIKALIHLPATTTSAFLSLLRTCSIRPTSVQACKFRTLFLKMAMKTLHISACKWNSILESRFIRFSSIIFLWRQLIQTTRNFTIPPLISHQISEGKYCFSIPSHVSFNIFFKQSVFFYIIVIIQISKYLKSLNITLIRIHQFPNSHMCILNISIKNIRYAHIS